VRMDGLVVSRRKGEITRLRACQGAGRRAAALPHRTQWVLLYHAGGCADLRRSLRWRPHTCGSRWASGVAHDAPDAEVTGVYHWSYAASAYNLTEMVAGHARRYFVSPMCPQLQSSEFLCPEVEKLFLYFRHLCGEPAGTRTQDHLIKSFPVTAFSLAKSTVMVANFRAGYPLKAGLRVA
jgi:hypothetical protein